MPVIPAFGRLRQEDLRFKANLCYIARPNLKKQKEVEKEKEDWSKDKKRRKRIN
jgi:hypothetical protein